MCQSIADGGRRCAAHVKQVVASKLGQKAVADLTGWTWLDDTGAEYALRTALLEGRDDWAGVRTEDAVRRAALRVEASWSALVADEYMELFDETDSVSASVAAFSPHSNQRAYGVRSPVCPPAVVSHAAVHDSDLGVRSEAVQHEQCPVDVVVYTARNDPNVSVRMSAVLSGRCPAEVAAHLVNNDVAHIRAAAVQHPGVPMSMVLHAAEHDAEPFVREAAFSVDRPFPVDVFTRVAVSEPDGDVRSMAMSNPRCPEQVAFDAIMNDPDDDVRETVAKVYLQRGDAPEDRRVLVALTFN